MNILHFSSAYSWRGGEQQIAYLIEELHKKNICQIIFCPQGSEVSKYCFAHNIDYYVYQKKNVLQLVYTFRRICKEKAIDIVHLHDSGAHTYAIFAATFLRHSTPLILSRRVDHPMKKNYFSKYKYNHKCIKKIICVSEAIRGMYLPAIQDTSKVTTIRSGIDISRFKYQASSILRKEFDIDADTLLIGNVAAISPHKDYFTFIDTVKLLQAAGIKAKYLAIGNQEDTEETTCIRQYIQAQELSEVIILTGHRTDIPQILPELDVFLFTSKTEGLGTSLLDAFACRVPVVATKAGGVPELVIHEQTGLLVPIQRPDLLAAEVLRLLQNSTLRQQLVHHAQEYLQNFTKENTAEKTLEVYESVLGNIQDKS